MKLLLIFCYYAMGPPLASRPGPVSTRRRTGARIRTPLAGSPPGPGSAVSRSRRPGRHQRPCRRELCVLTRRGCPILYVPAQRAPAKTEALLPSRFREGRREASSPPKMGGEERSRNCKVTLYVSDYRMISVKEL